MTQNSGARIQNPARLAQGIEHGAQGDLDQSEVGQMCPGLPGSTSQSGGTRYVEYIVELVQSAYVNKFLVEGIEWMGERAVNSCLVP